MGLVLDTSVLIDAERRRINLRLLLEELQKHAAGNISVSAITVMELAQGATVAKVDGVQRVREAFLNNLRTSIPVIALTDALATYAGQVNGLLLRSGVTIGMADAIIAATALTNGDAVATTNVRHFRLVPGLEVVGL